MSAGPQRPRLGAGRRWRAGRGGPVRGAGASARTGRPSRNRARQGPTGRCSPQASRPGRSRAALLGSGVRGERTELLKISGSSKNPRKVPCCRHPRMNFEREKVFQSGLQAWSAAASASPPACVALLNFTPVHTGFSRARVELLLPQNCKLPEETRVHVASICGTAAKENTQKHEIPDKE